MTGFGVGAMGRESCAEELRIVNVWGDGGLSGEGTSDGDRLEDVARGWLEVVSDYRCWVDIL